MQQDIRTLKETSCGENVLNRQWLSRWLFDFAQILYKVYTWQPKCH